MTVPELRFRRDDGAEYPEWKEKTVRELFYRKNRKNKDGAVSNVITNSAEYGLVPQRDFFDKDIAVEGKTDGYYIIEKGDFVYNPRKSSNAPFGPFNCYQLNDEGIVSPLYMCLTPRDYRSADYLLWYFQTNCWHEYIYLNGAQNGARHDRVGMTTELMDGIPVMLPCLEEQQKIASFLSDLDTVISVSEAEAAALEQQKKGVMQKIFSQAVRFRREDGTEYPEWEEKKFSSVVHKSRITEDPRSYPDKLYCEFSMPAYDENMFPRFIYGKEMQSVRLCIDRKMVLFNKLNVRKKRIWNIEEVPSNGVCSAEFLPFYSDCQVLHLFLYYWLGSDDVTEYVTSVSSGTSNSQKRISPDALDDYIILVPCLEEQKKIASLLSDMDAAIDLAKQELAQWKLLKKGLMQLMFA